MNSLQGISKKQEDDPYFALLKSLPVPQDDGACDHLNGQIFPSLALPHTVSSAGYSPKISLHGTAFTRSVLFFYPKTGLSHEDTPEEWNQIPGARGCTPQTCAFRDHYESFKNFGYQVFGISTQTHDYHTELSQRLRLPFALLSDTRHELLEGLGLPTFEFKGEKLFKRVTLVVENQRIVKIFYPVFPPHENASTVLMWLKNRSKRNTPSLQWNLHEEREKLVLSNRKELLQLGQIYNLLKKSHWASHRSVQTIQASMVHSDCYAVYENDLAFRQIAFARLITDHATFAYLCDVIVDEKYRGQGIAKWILSGLMKNPQIHELRRFVLATRDAHGLYEKFGFQTLSDDEKLRFMEIFKTER